MMGGEIKRRKGREHTGDQQRNKEDNNNNKNNKPKKKMNEWNE